MQQRFNTRNYSIRDFEEWDEKGELELAPKFQRRDVWTDKARSYLIDTIVRGKPIPKLYMRQDTNPKTRRTKREIVDGQQRLKTVLNFIKDGFKISKTHNDECGGKRFTQLDSGTQRDILQYEFVVDLLQDMPDKDVYDVFARINTYSVSLKAQELRHAQWFGEFRTAVYNLANDFVTFWEENRIFSSKQMLRMTEAEFVSELLIAMTEGIHEKQRTVIDAFYKQWDDKFPSRSISEKRFRETIDVIGTVFEGSLAESEFRATRLLYPLFCAIYHRKFGLPKLHAPRGIFKVADFPKIKIALEQVEDLIERAKAAEAAHEALKLSSESRRFYEAYRQHWVHADNRVTLTTHLCQLMADALKE